MEAIAPSLPSLPTGVADALSAGDNQGLVLDHVDSSASLSEPITTSCSIPGRGRRKQNTYRTRALDEDVPVIPVSQILNLYEKRPKRQTRIRPVDEHPALSYGDPIIQKHPESIRLFFQNSKGLTYTNTGEDYGYYMSCLAAYQVDIFGIAETNTCWSHHHLMSEFKHHARKYFRQNRIAFGSPSRIVDLCPERSTFQAGGNVTVASGKTSSCSEGDTLSDPTGLGRWSGLTFKGKGDTKVSIITAYRSCSGSIASSSLGSTYAREYEFFQRKGIKSPNPRGQFLTDLDDFMVDLRDGNMDHSIILMLDANAVLEEDKKFQDFVHQQELFDLHSIDPAPSTYIGAKNRRIDYIFGTERILHGLKRSGTLAYNEGPQSDHRGLYADVDLSVIFDPNFEPPVFQSAENRDLVSGNPEHVEHYLTKMNEYYEHHRMYDRMKDIHENHHNMSNDELRALLEGWDQDQGRAMMAAEKSLSTARKKTYSWSPTLRNKALLRKYWRLRLKEIDFQEDYQPTFLRIIRDMQRIDPEFTFPFLGEPLSRDTVSKHFTSASNEFRKCQRNSVDLRSQTYHDLMLSYEDDNNPASRPDSQRKLKIIQRTILSEAQRRVHKSLGSIVKPTQFNPLTTIEVPRFSDDDFVTAPGNVHSVLKNPDNREVVWDTIIKRGELEDHLLQYNRESFRAAAESPCGRGVIFDALTFNSLSPAATALLEGIVPPEWHGDDLALKEFLASFCVPESVREQDPIDTTISTDDVIKGFKSWSEGTSTSPSRRHLGHYKSLIQDPHLLQCLTWFLQVVTTRGIAISRWCNATNVLIEKDAGRPHINRLRIVHLFEADFNFFLKLQWGHRLIRRADKLGILNDGQYGSRPGRMAIEPVMLLQLTTDLCHLLKHNLARFDNDASACYDRIIVALGMLAARRCGMPDSAIRTHADELRLMKYTVKTVYGISEGNYKGTVFEPLFGTGQGSGASPAIWLTLVVLLMNTFERLVPDRMDFTSTDGLIVNSRVVDAFVDDTAIGFTDGKGDHTLETMIQRLQEISQTWEHLLFLSGGSLNLPKCSWYILTWDWVNGRPVIRQRADGDPTISLRSGASETETIIRRMDLDEAPRLLGVFLSPSGDFSKHISVLKDKADTFSVRLRSPKLKISDAMLFHRTIYVPTMRYSLATLAVDEECLKPIQTRILPALLQKMRLNSHLPTAIRHGPHLYGGLELCDLQTEGG